MRGQRDGRKEATLLVLDLDVDLPKRGLLAEDLRLVAERDLRRFLQGIQNVAKLALGASVLPNLTDAVRGFLLGNI